MPHDRSFLYNFSKAGLCKAGHPTLIDRFDTSINLTVRKDFKVDSGQTGSGEAGSSGKVYSGKADSGKIGYQNNIYDY